MSVSRHCDFFKAVDGRWYMELAHVEHGTRDDATTYGPFATEDAARAYRERNFSNPGGSWSEDSGTQAVPTVSPNGDPVVRP